MGGGRGRATATATAKAWVKGDGDGDGDGEGEGEGGEGGRGGGRRRGRGWGEGEGEGEGEGRTLPSLLTAPAEHLMGAGRGQDLVGPGRRTCYAIGTTASADPLGIFLPARDWDGSPGRAMRHSTRRATRPFGGAGLSSGSVRWRTRKRTTAGGPSGATDT